MAYPAPVQLSVDPTGQTQKEIENTIDAPRRLSEAIDEFRRKRANAEAELAQSLARDLAAGPLNVERAIEKHKAWKATDDLLAAKINTAEELRPIIEELIEELKCSQPDALKAVLRRKLEQLEQEAAAARQGRVAQGANRRPESIARGNRQTGSSSQKEERIAYVISIQR
jgi:hypothetical protein